MTLVTLPTVVYYPNIIAGMTNAPTFGTQVTISAVGHFSAGVFCARENMTISQVHFRAGTATGSPVVDVRIETVDASGIPSGTLWATNTNIVPAAITSNSDNLNALTASASISKGQVFAVKIAYSSGTSLIIQNMGTSYVSMGPSSFPYAVLNSGSNSKGSQGMILGVGSSSTTFYQLPSTIPASSQTGNTYNNSVAGAKRGLRFQVPFACRMVGIRWFNSNLAGDYNALLDDDSGAELSNSSTAFDGDHNAAGTQALNVFFDNAVNLSANTWYRACIEPTSATNVNIQTFTLPNTNYHSACPGGANFQYTTFTTGGGWVDSTTQIPLMDILIDQMDDGIAIATGGGGVISG